MATHSSILAWEIPRTEDPGGLQSMGSKKSGARLRDCACTLTDVLRSCLPAWFSSWFMCIAGGMKKKSLPGLPAEYILRQGLIRLVNLGLHK